MIMKMVMASDNDTTNDKNANNINKRIGMLIAYRNDDGKDTDNAKHENNNDYVLLELNNGELNYKWNVDGMTNLVKFTPKLARNELCNSSWIRIKLRKEDKGRIMLESKGNQIINNFNKEIIVKNDMVNLYLGALPVRSAYAEISQTNEPFIGCIRDLAIKKNNGLYANNKALLGMDLQDGVLNYCPLK